MKKIKFLSLVVLIAFAAINSRAQSLEKNEVQKQNAYQVISNKFLSSDNGIKSNFVLPEIDSSKIKSPLLGAGMSLLIPGAGEIYAKSYVKSAIFIAVEAGLWIAYSVFQKKGDDQTQFFENYADENWSIRRYASWLKEQSFPKSGDIDLNTQDLNSLRHQVNLCEEASGFSHTLPYFGDQQYYEVIGKYQTYISGWSTAEGKGITKNNYITFRLEQVSYYMGERQRANDYYNKGTTALTVVILNHLASAVDAFLTIKSHNNKLSASANLSFAPVFNHNTNDFVITPFANVRINF